MMEAKRLEEILNQDDDKEQSVEQAKRPTSVKIESQPVRDYSSTIPSTTMPPPRSTVMQSEDELDADYLAAIALSKAELVQSLPELTFVEIDRMSIPVLKEAIVSRGGECSDCIDTGDLRLKLKNMMEAKMLQHTLDVDPPASSMDRDRGDEMDEDLMQALAISQAEVSSTVDPSSERNTDDALLENHGSLYNNLDCDYDDYIQPTQPARYTQPSAYVQPSSYTSSSYTLPPSYTSSSSTSSSSYTSTSYTSSSYSLPPSYTQPSLRNQLQSDRMDTGMDTFYEEMDEDMAKAIAASLADK